MPFNPSPLTEFQQKLLNATRNRLLEIRDPDKEVLDNLSFDLYIERTKKHGPIPKIRFHPNALTIKAEIMDAAGYKQIVAKDGWRKARNAKASAFDKHWDALMAGLIKGARKIAIFNLMFANPDQDVSDIIRLVQQCIAPNTTKSANPDPSQEPQTHQNPAQTKSYAQELEELRE